MIITEFRNLIICCCEISKTASLPITVLAKRGAEIRSTKLSSRTNIN